MRGETGQLHADHPSHVYLNEQRLNDALFPFLAAALFGPERTDYWRTCLEAAAEPGAAAPTAARAQEIEDEVADLERRLTRQLVNLEADDVTAALRRRVVQRVAELETAIAERRERLVALARESATEAPTLADVAPLLDRLPILADRLAEAPQGELLALFDTLQLDVIYQPADSAVDVAVTLYDGGNETANSAAQVRAEDWCVRAPGLPQCEPRSAGGGSGDQPGRSPHEGPPRGVLGVRGLHWVATTVAITPAGTVASPERSTVWRAKCQRGGSPTPPVANPDFMGLFV